MNQQYEWAEALRKAHTTAQIRPASLGESLQPKISLTQLQEQMDYYKTKLGTAVQNNDTTEIQDLIDRMINAHARMTALIIKQEKERGARDNSPIIRSHLEKYFSDCTELVQKFPS